MNNNKYLSVAGLGLVLVTLLFSCKTEPAGPWEAFTACATNACVKEVVAVKDAFLKDPKSMMDKFEESNEQGTDHFVGWLYILRDSVLLNGSYASIEERLAMQQQIVQAAKAFEQDAKYGDWATSITGEIGGLALGAGLEGSDGTVAGTYTYELPNDGGAGELKVSLNTGGSLQFDLSVVAGPPAHNQGMMQGLAQQAGPNTFEYTTTEFGGTCKLQFIFEGETVEVKTLEGDAAACGFGNNVRADQVYRKKANDDSSLSAADAALSNNLPGSWVSTTDAKSELIIENGLYTEVYDGKQVGQFPYKFSAQCPADCNPVGETPCISLEGQDVVCYAVVKADGKSLELSMIGGRGNTLVYKKK